MTFFSAVSKLIKRKNSKSYYNSDCILTVKEKQTLIIGVFLTITPVLALITSILIS